MTDINYSIIVPVYKSKESLKQITNKINEVFEKELKGAIFELIFINDSPFDDGTCRILDELCSSFSFIKVIELTQNFGQQSALICGISESKGQYIITMDDDMQHNPLDIPKLIEKQAHDIVVASFIKKRHSIFKRLTSFIKGYFDHIILDKPRHIQLTSFRLFNRVIADNILKIGTSYPFIPALLLLVTKDIVNVQVNHHERLEGKSNYTLRKLFKLFANLLINNSSLLLKWIGYLGLTSALVSLIYSGIIIYRAFVYDVVLQGWTSIMVAILFFGGMIMFTVGILGEYLIRIIHTSEKRPHYFIRKIKDKSP